MKSSRIFLILLMIIALLGYLSQRVTKDEITLSKIYDEPKRADKPEVYLSIYDELTTKPGKNTPDYPIGYRYKELEKARSERPILRTEASYEFTERGPANVPGRTRGLLVDPDDPQYKTWFAGGVGGGIWKTSDGGATWAEQTKNLPNLAISWIVMAPSDHSIMYAGTGEGWGGSSGFIKGNGIVKSTDGGNSWAPLLATIENTDFEIVNRIIVDPDDANIILVATSTDRANNPYQASGIFKSIDGGDTWLKKHTGDNYVQQIIADPTDFNTQYAAVYGIGIIKSLDAGETWTDSSTGLSISGRIEIAVSPVHSARLYASAQGDLTGTGADLYFSSDYGETWDVTYNINEPTANFLGGQGWFDNTILAHPFNLDEVYVGGVDFWKFKVDDTTKDLGNQFVGVDEEGIEDFFELTTFNSGSIYDNKISVGDEDRNDLVSVEIRFGPDEEGGILTQMAHRFVVPDGLGSGVPDADYTYENYVEVPFQVWDIKNNRQLMISFRDQQKDLVFNLLNFESDNENWQNNSREYLFISNITYDPTTPDVNITIDGGHMYKNLYFMWPFLPEGQIWDPSSFPTSLFRIRYNRVIGKTANSTAVADAYGQYSGNNSFVQLTGYTTVTGVHPDHHNIVSIIHEERLKNFQLLLANDGGIYSSDISDDPGVPDESWTFSGLGYNTSQFYAVDKAPGESRYIGGLQDNGTWMSGIGQEGKSTSLYRRVNGGDGFGTAWNYADKQLILSTIYYNQIEKSTNEGGSSSSSVNGMTDVGAALAPFITEIEYNHADPNVVYTVGASGVWKSEDFGDNWTLAPIDINWRRFSTMYARISQANSHIVWAGTGMSSILGVNFHVSTDAGISFMPVEQFSQDMGRASGFATHPTLDSTAFALFSFAKSPKILRTDDLGQTWYDLSGFDTDVSSNGFPDVSIRDLLVMPNDTSIIWAATEIGIFESTDAGGSWHILAGDLPAVSVWDMKIVDKEVVLGTHGRGIWTTEIEDLPGHIYLPRIISDSPTLDGIPTFDIQLLNDFDSVILYVNQLYSGKIGPVEQFDIVNMPGSIASDQIGSAYVRAYKNGRPFVSNSYDFELFNYNPVVDSYSNDFEDGNLDDFEGNGFTIQTYIDFIGRAIHSKHSYNNNVLYQYILKSPIKVRSSEAFINYTEVVLVEPGNEGALPGSAAFKDYVAVQGSKDGINWINLTDPYDASARLKWESKFGPFGVGNQDMLLFRAIDLQNNFDTGDEVIIRFILKSDNEVNGWGWMIDNLKIQTDNVIADLNDEIKKAKFTLYPNPIKGNTLKIESQAGPRQIVCKLFNVEGQLEFEKSIKISGFVEIEIPSQLKNGIYIALIEDQDVLESYKIIIDR